jgi:hypothetical protein
MPSRSALDRVRVVHRHQWLWEPLEVDPTFVLRSMFGAKAVYLGGRMVLCFCAGDEPWRGLLVCTERAHHAALLAEFTALVPHAILPKWLYLAEAAPSFERDASKLVTLSRQRDPRIGIEPKTRRKSKPARASGRSTRKRKPRVV